MSTVGQGRRPSRLARTQGAVVRAVCKLSGCEDAAPSSRAVPIDLSTGPATRDLLRPASEGAPAGVALRATGLTKVYAPDVVGARDVDLVANVGEIVAVVGPNGAGKSTTLNMLCGLLQPTAGTATVHGIPVTDTKRLSTVLGVALQTSGLDPAMTGGEHFRVQAALYRMPGQLAHRRTELLLEAFGLQPYVDRPVAQFSVGLQRRLVVALSLLHDPAVILLDEPTAGLDPQSRRMVWNLLNDLRSEGRTIVFSTQLLEEADMLAQRMYVIADGGVVAHGTPPDLRQQYGELTVKVRIDGPVQQAAQLLSARLPHLPQSRLEGEVLVISGVQGDQQAQQVMSVLTDARLAVVEFSLARPSLEEAFVTLTGSVVRPEPVLTTGGPGVALCRCS